MVDSMSELMPVPRVRKSDSISSKKTMTGMPSSAFSRARWKTWRIWRSVSPTYLFKQLGALDVEEEAPHVGVAGALGHLLGQGVGHGLGDEGLAAPGRAVEEDALGGRQAVLGEELLVQVGQLDRVGDGLYLRVEPADVGVGDVGHLFEDELLALELGQLLYEELGAQVHEEGVAGAQLDVEHVLGELGHALLVGPGEHDATAFVLQPLLEGDHLAGELPVPDEDHVQRLVQHHLVALADDARIDVGVERDPHLAPAGEDVHGAVVVDPEEGAVGGGRLGQLLDLLAQRGQLLLGLLEGEGQLLVLRGGVGQLALALEQALLEGLDPPRALLEAASEGVDLVLGVGQLGTQRLGQGGQLVRVGWDTHTVHPSPGAGPTGLRPQKGL